MDVVPYAFCDAVCAVLKDLYALMELTFDNSNCGIWNAAAEATDDARVAIQVDVTCEDGVWSYRIRKTAKNEEIGITFPELKAISRCCVQTSTVTIGNRYGYSMISTLNEAREILKYSVPFVNSAEMWINSNLEIPDVILAELLSLFCNSSFSHICVGGYSKAAEGFLRTLLQSEGSKIIDIFGDGWSDELRVSIEHFVLTKSFVYLRVNDVEGENSLVFGLKFLKKLLRKSCRHDRVTFTARFRVKFRKLRKLKKEMLIQTDDDTIGWRRRDGVKMKIERFYIDHFGISFICYN